MFWAYIRVQILNLNLNFDAKLYFRFRSSLKVVFHDIDWKMIENRLNWMENAAKLSKNAVFENFGLITIPKLVLHFSFSPTLHMACLTSVIS